MEKQVIPDYQFGFRNSHSTSLQLARIIDLIVTGFNKRDSTIAVFLDIEKAFDTTWINGLIYKLIQTQISAPLIKLISTYLNNRKFCISVDGFHSDCKTINAGVPQGAVLSPILNNIYVADIPTRRQVHMAQFADDTCIFYQSKFKNRQKVIKVLQESIDDISTWFAKWNIKINANKTEAITFSKTKRELNAPIKIQNQVIPYSISVKYLGLTLYSKLAFKNHVSKLKKNIMEPILYYIHFSSRIH